MSGVMAVSLGIAICSNAFQLSLCKPIWFIWDHTHPNPVCMDPKKAQISIYVNAGLTIATDIIHTQLCSSLLHHFDQDKKTLIS